MSYLWKKSVKKKSVTKDELCDHHLTCKLCDLIINSSAIKCRKCCSYLHTTCFDKAAEIFDVEKNDWLCKNCLQKNSRNVELQIVMNHNECLRDQVKLLTHLISEQDYINFLQKQRLQELEDLVSVYSFHISYSHNYIDITVHEIENK